MPTPARKQIALMSVTSTYMVSAAAVTLQATMPFRASDREAADYIDNPSVDVNGLNRGGNAANRDVTSFNALTDSMSPMVSMSTPMLPAVTRAMNCHAHKNPFAPTGAAWRVT